MTTRAVISCDGQIGPYDCRQAVPVGIVTNGAQARYEAKVQFGWSSALVAGRILDLCEACTQRRQISLP